ncbi:hypothetical protein ACIPPN_30515 [Streptomyces diastaticus]|uniref:Type II toxin-antitoxin system Phd/YefM family antitoxin n=1 Tax=Streptomyces diastaticus subsp. diastaticus TaxID=68040 RepID=A0ABQ1CS37_STRDI|nr:hypothetical protein [Streptomyces diastaticus]GFH72935.1 hypothetical protein Sdia_37030 [Streptomyces diastaticus subsp. diastaticus]GGU48911.1 hypothetical protein GCM10015534_58770 [Streptomyces diastaticus subsp. diastaticus]
MPGKPRQVVVDGKPMIAMPEKQFESLLAMRRQLGSQTAKLRMLRDTLTDLSEFLDTVAEALDTAGTDGSRETSSPLTAEMRRRARQARGVAGSGRASKRRHSPDRNRT